MSRSICIVLSTYNGEKYLAEQLDSLLNQDVDITRIHIRDDGSTDGTRSLIEKYCATNPQITCSFGENIGWRRSFVQGLRECPDFDFYSFCDQDDVWLPDKIGKALAMIEDLGHCKKPVLYAGNVMVSDSDLRPQFLFNQEPASIEVMDFPSTVYHDGMAGGLTYVFNQRAADMLVNCSFVGETGHDRLLMLICKAYGIVRYDFNSYVSYRQHSSNVFGGYASKEKTSKLSSLRSYLVLDDKRSELANALLELGEDEDRETDVSNYLKLCSVYKTGFMQGLKLFLFHNLGGINWRHELKMRLKIVLKTY